MSAATTGAGGSIKEGEGCHLKGFMLVNKVSLIDWRRACLRCLPSATMDGWKRTNRNRDRPTAQTQPNKLLQVAGNFHIAFGDSIVKDGRHIHQFIPSEAPFFNVSHRIHHVSFGDEYPGRINPLDGKVTIDQHSSLGGEAAPALTHGPT